MSAPHASGSEAHPAAWPTAGTLATSLGEAVFAAAEEAAHDAAHRLAGRYDQAPVRGDGGQWVGFAHRNELAAAGQARVSELTHPLAPVLLPVSAHASELLPLLSEHGFAFVGDADAPIGFVTPSDLSRQAGRALFYLRIAAFEIELADLLRRSRIREEQHLLLRHMSRASRRDIECSYLLARDADTEVDYVSYMDLTDLLVATGGERDLRRLFGAGDQPAWQKQVGGLPGLRNDVMHSTREFVSPDRTIAKLAEQYVVLGKLERLAADGFREPTT